MNVNSKNNPIHRNLMETNKLKHNQNPQTNSEMLNVAL